MDLGKRLTTVLEDVQLDIFHYLSGSINTVHQWRDGQKLREHFCFHFLPSFHFSSCPCCLACGILVSRSEIKARPMAVKAPSVNL